MLTEIHVPRSGRARSLSCSTMLPGCGTLYVAQAARGQWQVMHARQPIAEVIADRRHPRMLRARLTEVTRGARIRLARAGSAGQRELSLLCGREAPVRRVERSGCAGILREAATLVLSDRRLRRLSRLFRGRRARGNLRRACASGASTCSSAACRRTRRSASSRIRCSTRCSSYGDNELAAIIFHELSHQLIYVAGRFGIQRGVRGHGRGDGPAALAEGARARGSSSDATSRGASASSNSSRCSRALAARLAHAVC